MKQECRYTMHKVCWFYYNRNREIPESPCNHFIVQWYNPKCKHRNFDGLELFGGCHRQLTCKLQCNVYPCQGENREGLPKECCDNEFTSPSYIYEWFFLKYDIEGDAFDGNIDVYYEKVLKYFEEDVTFEQLRKEILDDLYLFL